MILMQSYRRPHLLPHGLLSPMLQHLASGDLPVAEGITSGEPPVPEGVAFHEVPPVLELPLVSELASSFSLSDTTVHIQYIYEKMNLRLKGVYVMVCKNCSDLFQIFMDKNK